LIHVPCEAPHAKSGHPKRPVVAVKIANLCRL
jgi:hypothetical protein